MSRILSNRIFILITTITMTTGLVAHATCGGGTATGTIAGGVVGGILGNQIGGGRGRQAATILGALGGAAVGSNQQQRQNNFDCGYQNPAPVQAPMQPEVIYETPRSVNVPQSTPEVVAGNGIYRDSSHEFTCQKIVNSYWDGYQQIRNVTNESLCSDGYSSIRVDNAYVYYHMICRAESIDSGEIFGSSFGTPRQQGLLQRRALRQCESSQGVDNCAISVCDLAY